MLGLLKYKPGTQAICINVEKLSNHLLGMYRSLYYLSG